MCKLQPERPAPIISSCQGKWQPGSKHRNAREEGQEATTKPC